jgi:hypothetical protein
VPFMMRSSSKSQEIKKRSYVPSRTLCVSKWSRSKRLFWKWDLWWLLTLRLAETHSGTNNGRKSPFMIDQAQNHRKYRKSRTAQL